MKSRLHGVSSWLKTISSPLFIGSFFICSDICDSSIALGAVLVALSYCEVGWEPPSTPLCERISSTIVLFIMPPPGASVELLPALLPGIRLWRPWWFLAVLHWFEALCCWWIVVWYSSVALLPREINCCGDSSSLPILIRFFALFCLLWPAIKAYFWCRCMVLST